MTHDPSTEETTVIATYSTRRDAELALDRLENENIRGFVTADDAGAMHPELQRPQGVKLVVLRDAAAKAHEALEDAGLLPPMRSEDAGQEAEPTDEPEHLTFSTQRPAFIVAFVIVVALLTLGVWLSSFV